MSYIPDPNSDDCTVDEFFGSGHPYNYCISTADDVLDKSGSRSGCHWLGVNCIEKNMAGFGKYIGALFANPSQILDASCGEQLGNKYVLKTGTKCFDPLIQKQVDRYTYINNMDNNEIFGIEMLGDNPEGVGILPSSLSKATRINGGGLFSAIISETEPECKKVKLKCHILNKYKELYDGSSNYVHIAVDEIEKISDEDIKDFINDKNHDNYLDAYSHGEGFSNINNNFNTNKDILNDTYYFLLALILLYVIFKIIHKK